MQRRRIVIMWTFVTLVILAGCAGSDPTENATGAHQPPGQDGQETFEATAISENGRPRPLVADSTIRLVFDGDTITATAGCNELTNRASVADDERLVVSDLITTDKACRADLARQESWLVEFLQAQPSWSRDGDQLVLRTATAELRLTV